MTEGNGAFFEQNAACCVQRLEGVNPGLQKAQHVVLSFLRLYYSSLAT